MNRYELINHPGFIPSFTAFVLYRLKEVGVETTEQLIEDLIPTLGKMLISAENEVAVSLFYQRVVPFIDTHKDDHLSVLVAKAATRAIHTINESENISATLNHLPSDISTDFLDNWVMH